MVDNFEVLTLDQEVTNKTEGQNAYPSPQFEDAWFNNFKQLFNPVATTAELDDASSTVNTQFKSAGRSVLDTTTGVPVWATGELTSDVWADATGATVNTPV